MQYERSTTLDLSCTEAVAKVKELPTGLSGLQPVANDSSQRLQNVPDNLDRL